MEISIAELFLLLWAVVATVAWRYARYNHEEFKYATVEVIKKVVAGKLEFVIVDDFNVTVKEKVNAQTRN
jgi:membrane-bound lytic murein transglycosylase MltF